MNFKKWRTISIIFSIVIGTLLHFTYEWFGENFFVGAFSAVNESTWEHLKLVFFPMAIIAFVGYFIFGKEIKNYIKANIIGIIFSISFITVFFYTYMGIIGKNIDVLNIASFIVAIIGGEYITYRIIKNDTEGNEKLYLKIFCVLLIMFVTFTYFPPKINLFKDPITNTYGIQEKGDYNG